MSSTAPAIYRAPTFPDFLLDDVLDHLHLDALLLSAMPVSTYWRARVISHPHYWSNLELKEEASSVNVDSRKSVPLFMLRLSRAKAGPIWVHVQHEDPGAAVIREIARHLGHITFLFLCTPLCYVSQALQAFRTHPAPSLTTFHLISSFRPESEFSEEIVVPVDLFASTAPLLETVNLSGVRLVANAPFPPFLANLTFLGYGYASPTPSPVPNLFRECPNLSKLNLLGTLALDDPAFAQANNWARLRQLSFNLFDLGTNELPTDGVRRIIYHASLHDAHAVAGVAERLDGPLSVAFHLQHAGAHRNTPYTVTLRSTVAHPERERWIMTKLPETPPGAFPADLITALQHPPVVGRIVRLVLALSNWDALVGPRGVLAGLPALEDLVLMLVEDAPDTAWSASSQISCPRLQRLVLRAWWDDRPVVCIAAVASFARAALPDTRFPLRLELNEVALDGSESWENFPDVFSGCEARALTEIDDNR